MANTFDSELKTILRRKIAQLKRGGTVAMGADNLWQITTCEISHCPSAPVGTNAAYYARESFNAVIAAKPFNSFLLS